MLDPKAGKQQESTGGRCVPSRSTAGTKAKRGEAQGNLLGRKKVLEKVEGLLMPYKVIPQGEAELLGKENTEQKT